ncbi:hypothetical protein EYR40_006788 [Pleurotus pulmonarius]|nr:hypothetical protein EYR36_011406 [Pleurotus pulmonarius]KAF4599689.1 hypothetical protein EYR40_006788 [Pleurotus pulmonarius]
MQGKLFIGCGVFDNIAIGTLEVELLASASMESDAAVIDLTAGSADDDVVAGREDSVGGNGDAGVAPVGGPTTDDIADDKIQPLSSRIPPLPLPLAPSSSLPLIPLPEFLCSLQGLASGHPRCRSDDLVIIEGLGPRA